MCSNLVKRIDGGRGGSCGVSECLKVDGFRERPVAGAGKSISVFDREVRVADPNDVQIVPLIQAGRCTAGNVIRR